MVLSRDTLPDAGEMRVRVPSPTSCPATTSRMWPGSSVRGWVTIFRVEPGKVSVNTTTIVVAAVVVVVFVAAGVVLAVAGWSTGAIAGLLTSLVGVVAVVLPLLDRVVNTARETSTQTVTLAKIDKRTNGELDARIEDAIHSALDRFTKSVLPAQTVAELPEGEPSPLPAELPLAA